LEHPSELRAGGDLGRVSDPRTGATDERDFRVAATRTWGPRDLWPDSNKWEHFARNDPELPKNSNAQVFCSQGRGW